MALHKSVQIYTESGSRFRIIAIFKSFLKQNKDSNKICRYVHDPLLYQNS
jgi:hypothetical protein